MSNFSVAEDTPTHKYEVEASDGPSLLQKLLK
jgi:hypothetical protein